MANDSEGYQESSSVECGVLCHRGIQWG